MGEVGIMNCTKQIIEEKINKQLKHVYKIPTHPIEGFVNVESSTLKTKSSCSFHDKVTKQIKVQEIRSKNASKQ